MREVLSNPPRETYGARMLRLFADGDVEVEEYFRSREHWTGHARRRGPTEYPHAGTCRGDKSGCCGGCLM